MSLSFKATNGAKYVVKIDPGNDKGDITFEPGKAYLLGGEVYKAPDYIINPSLVAKIQEATSLTPNEYGWIYAGGNNQAVLEDITDLDVSSCNDPTVCDEIGALKGLVSLQCAGNHIKELDLSKLTKLETLNAQYNDLTELDLSNNTQLKVLALYYNRLSFLDVAGLSNLEYLVCNNNQLSSLDLNSASLVGLNCDYNKIQRITSQKPLSNLTSLQCSSNQLLNLDGLLSNATQLVTLYCNNNKISNLSLSSLTNLEYLACANNQIGYYLELYSTQLKRIECQNNNIQEIHVKGADGLKARNFSLLTNLEVLHAYGNNLQNLFIYDLTKLDIASYYYFQIGNQKNGEYVWVYVSSKQYKKKGDILNANNNKNIIWKYDKIDYITNANLIAEIKTRDGSVTTDSEGDISVAANKAKLEAIDMIELQDKDDPNCCDEINVLTGLEVLNCCNNGIQSLD